MTKWISVTSINIILILIISAFVGVTKVSAQGNQANILGTVTDDSGGVVQGATVTLTSIEKGFTRTATTSKDGVYDISHVEPGNYSLTIEKASYKQFTINPLKLESNKVARVDVNMKVGDVAETVDVDSQSPVIETERSQISDYIEEKTLRTQPMAGRGYLNWILLHPGSQYGNIGYSFNGSRGTQVNIRLDGVQHDVSPVEGWPSQSGRPDQELIEEMRLDSVNNSAQFGSQASITQTTKSGSNDYHGQFSWAYNAGTLNAKNFFATQRPPALPVNSLYLSTGGPLVIPKVYDGHNRTFWFIHGEGLNFNQAVTSRYSFPTAAMRQGDFSAVGTIIDPQTGQPFQGNIIPTNRLNQSALNFMNRFIPVPNTPSATPSNNVVATFLGGDTRTERAWSFRIDQKVNDKNTMFVRYWGNLFNVPRPDGGLPPDILGFLKYRTRDHAAILSDTHVFSSTMVNEAKLGFDRLDFIYGTQFPGKQAVALLGLTGYPYQLNDQPGFTNVTIAGLTPINATGVINNIAESWNIVDNLTILRGAHSFKTGVDILFNNEKHYPGNSVAQFGSFNFDGFVTGQPFADFLLGIPQQSSRSLDIGRAYGTNSEWAVYLQDDWRVHPNLTLNLGLRYERHNPFKEQRDRISSFDLKTGAIVVPNDAVKALINPLFPQNIPVETAAQAGVPERPLVFTDKNDFAPRVGFAWRTHYWDVVLRGGYGIYYSFQSRKAFSNYTGITGGPFIASEVFLNSLNSGVPLWQWPSAFPSGPAVPLGTQSVNAIIPNMRDAYVNQWNLTAEKQIRDYGIRLSYIGSSGIKLFYHANANLPFPSTLPFDPLRRRYPLYGTINILDQGATQSYNSFQAEVVRRFTHGFSLTAHYTWAKNLTDVQDVAGFETTLNPYDVRGSKGRELYTPDHKFIAYWLWEVPVGDHRRYLGETNSVLNGVIGGWSLSGQFSAVTGPWATPNYFGVDSSNTATFGGRPDRICDGNLPSGQRTIEKWYDPSCFVVPPANAGRFGNSGVGIIEAPGSWSANLGIFKYIPVKERLRVRLDGRFNNVFNHPKFGGKYSLPNMTINSPGAGVISDTDYAGVVTDSFPQRMIEVGLRVEW